MGNSPSQNTVAPIHQLGKGSDSGIWDNDIQDYMTPEEMKEADLRALQVSEHPISVEQLTTNLSKDSKNDISCIRSFFKWICNNIRYDPKSNCTDVMTILSTKRCSSAGYACLFERMCRLRNIFVIRLKSCVKNYSFVLNCENLEDKTHQHVWNAVLIDKKFHYVDCSWGASIVNGHDNCDSDSEDREHFFFMSPKIVGDYC